MGKVNFGKNNSTKTIQRIPTVENPIIIDKVIETSPSTITKIEEVIKPVEVVVEKIVEKIIEVEKPVEVIKEVIVEVPVVVTKIETVEIEKPVEVIVEKVITVIDTTALMDERKKTVSLETKLKRSYIAIACLIVITMIVAVI